VAALQGQRNASHHHVSSRLLKRLGKHADLVQTAVSRFLENKVILLSICELVGYLFHAVAVNDSIYI
jgi:hypothetical protein